MKKVFITAALVAALGFVPVLAEESKEMPMKGPLPMTGVPMKGETHCGMDMGKMAEMHKRMGSMMEMMKMMGDMSGTKKDSGTHEPKETK